MPNPYPNLFTQDEIKNDSYDLKKINKATKDNISKLKYFKKLTDVSKLKIGNTVRYIRPSENYKFVQGGIVKNIVEKKDNYLITIRPNLPKEWDILSSKVVLFYRTMTTEDVKQKDYEEYKAKQNKKALEDLTEKSGETDSESVDGQLTDNSSDVSSEESKEVHDEISDEAKQLFDALFDLENWFTCGYMKIIKKIWRKDSQHYFNKYKNCHFLNQFYLSLDEDNRAKLLNESMNQLTNHTLDKVHDAISLYVWFYSLVGLGQLYIYLDYDVDSIQTPLDEFDFVDFLMHCKNCELEIIYKEYKKYEDK
jgi:hypothetical protein